MGEAVDLVEHPPYPVGLFDPLVMALGVGQEIVVFARDLQPMERLVCPAHP